MHRIDGLRALTGLLLTLALGGCSTAPLSMGGAYAPLPPKPQPGSEYLKPERAKKPVVSCEVYLEKIDDLRADKEHMGSVAGRPIHGVDMLTWLSTGLSTLDAAGYRMDSEPSQAANLVVDVELLKAYLESQSTSIASTIVVRVTYKRPDATVLGQQLYRGSDTSLNWANGDGEINTDFKLATADMLQKVQPDMGRYCASARQPGPAAVAAGAAQR